MEGNMRSKHSMCDDTNRTMQQDLRLLSSRLGSTWFLVVIVVVVVGGLSHTETRVVVGLIPPLGFQKYPLPCCSNGLRINNKHLFQAPIPSKSEKIVATTRLISFRKHWATLLPNNELDDNENDNTLTPPQPQQRIKARFDNLFSGMPSMNEILGGGFNNDSNNPEETMDEVRSFKKKGESMKKKKAVDDTWFTSEREQIQQDYNDILESMLAQLATERQQNPDTVPENAEALIKSVLEQDMEREITKRRTERMEERLDLYEQEVRTKADEQDIGNMQPNEEIQKLVEESRLKYAQQEANRLEIEDFLRYEKEAILKNSDQYDTDAAKKSIVQPEKGENLDQWALDRLREMADDRQDTDGDEMILDILQDNVQTLEDRMGMAASQSASRQAKSMKEWQMYRSIATRLEGSGVTESSLEKEILAKLDSWKDYIQKENDIRKQSGLARGPKLPFNWQEAEPYEREIPKSDASDKQSRIDTRKQLNRMSIEAMESLLSTTDVVRRDRLQKEIDFLKTSLEGKDYLDVEESMLEDTVSSTAVDFSDVFQSFSKDTDDTVTPSVSFVESFDTGSSYTSRKDTMTEENDITQSQLTPFFKDDVEYQPTIPTPNTAFFTDDADVGEILTGDSKLGTMEDQKLEAMYRRARARTTEERTAIRKQWEDFQEFEQQRREQSGLSSQNDNDTIGPNTDSLKYDIADVMRENGDFDAEAILSAIGPRPKRTKEMQTKTSIEMDKESDPDDPIYESKIDQKEVVDSLYRAVSAVGGGRYKDDPDAKAEQKAAYEKYLEKEKELRETLNNPIFDDDAAAVITLSTDTSEIDDVEYAEEVLASLGSRPQPKRSRRIDPGAYSDEGGVLSSFDYDDDDDDDSDSDSDSDVPESNASDAVESNEIDVDLIPEWLRRENEEAIKRDSGNIRRKGAFLGSEIDDVFDDTDYEHNMRQFKEYEKRRAGQTRQMGIDISDVLGRSAFNSDDYADYKYEDIRDIRREKWNTDSFASQKANLLEYTELDVSELNRLMDQKDSVYSTGVSQYLPRINKPFSAFGAIFRLESVLVDIIGIQLQSWTKVATEYGFKSPSVEEVRLASVTRPEVAIKDIFFWTNDFFECRRIAALHADAFKGLFTAWMDETGISVPEVAVISESMHEIQSKGKSTLNSLPPKLRSFSEVEKLKRMSMAWTATAEAFGKKVPNQNEVIVAASINADIAVTKAFRWSSDPLEVDNIVQTYRRNLSSALGERNDPIIMPHSPSTSVSDFNQGTRRHTFTKTEVMEMHYEAWKRVAESFGFDPPSSEEVLTAFVINEAEVAARGFGWTDDELMLRNVAFSFAEKLAELKGIDPISFESATPDAAPAFVANDGPTPDEIFRISYDSWVATAKVAGLKEPLMEQVQFALSVGPEEAIITGFEWAFSPDEVKNLLEIYKSELARRRASWMTDSSVKNTPSPATESSIVNSDCGPNADELYLAVFNAWTDTSKNLGFPMPDDDQVQFAMSVGPEEAVITGFGWTSDRNKASEIVECYKAELSTRRAKWINRGAVSGSTRTPKEAGEVPMFKVKPGAAKLLKSLLDVEMQCVVISNLEGDQVNVLLQQAGLDDLISPDKRVSTSNGYMTEKDQLLGAALRLERRSDHCVVFDTTPYASDAAHAVGMQSVGLIGPYPRYELLSADTTSNSLDDLSAMNIRRLFGERVYDQPQVESQQQNQSERRSLTKTRFFYDDE